MAEKTLQLLFELAINWETQAHDLYTNFAKLFNHEPSVSTFWMQSARDESGHIDVLKDIFKKIPSEYLLKTISKEHWNSVIQVEELIKEATTKKIKTLNDAYEMAHQLEMSEVNTLFKMLVHEYLPDEKGHQFIVNDIGEHIERLMRFGKEYTQLQRMRIYVHGI